MNAIAASALRRGAIAGGALGATLVGHMLTVNGWRLLPVAPLLWVGLVALTILTAARRGDVGFAAWRPAKVLMVLVVAQMAFHLVLDYAPWAFGLVMTQHDHAPVLSLSAVVVHASIALLLWGVLCFGQRILVGAVAVARALLSPERRRGPGGGGGRILRDVAAAPARWRHGSRTSRGPPAGHVRPANPGHTLILR